MSVYVEIVRGALKPARLAVGKGTGAFVVFEGVVRAEEAGKKIRSLDYQVYEPMASKQLQLLAEAMQKEFGVLDVSVWHSKGKVGVGKVSFRLVVESAHRAEALEATGEFIDRMKRDVPIWKKPVFAEARSRTPAPSKKKKSKRKAKR
ncbi:MAG: molybdenum cofactor biosynthesis protein MoaE [Phycisphaeraceae bacterium]|nr:molybdenum cofactor biosynthesis protein MoaE [Phycisphaeraceae bacterium]